MSVVRSASRFFATGALIASALFSACSNQDGLVQPEAVTMNMPSGSHLVATPATIVPIAGDLGAFTNVITASNQGRDNGGPFYDNLSAGDLSGPTNCSIGHFILGIMAQCHYAVGSSNSNSPAVGAVFAGGSYWGLQGNPTQPAGFMFSGSQSYTVVLQGGYRGGDSEIGWFTVDGSGYHFNPVAAWTSGPGAAPTPYTVNPNGANWGFYYANTFNGHTGGGGCGGLADHYCTNATGGIPANPLAGAPGQQQFALFINTAANQFAVGVEDNQLQLISDGNGLLHDSDYQDYIFTLQPQGIPLQLGDLSITKTGAATANTGAQVVYTVTGKNNGPVDATGVTIVDTLPFGATYVTASNSGVHTTATIASQTRDLVTWNVGALANGASTVGYTVTVLYAAAGTYTNNSHINEPAIETSYTNNHADATTVVTVPKTLDLSITKTGPATVNTCSDKVTYTITGKNNGQMNAAGVVIIDTLPYGATYVSASNSGVHTTATINGQKRDIVTWTVGTLANGASTVGYTVTVTYAQNGTYVNNSHINSTTAETDYTNNHADVTTMVGPPKTLNLGITKTGPSTAKTGDQVVYNITGKNVGQLDAANVVIIDTLPYGAKYVSATGGGVHSTAIINGQVRDLITWTLGTVKAGTSTICLTVTVTYGAAGTYINNAHINTSSTETNYSNNHDDATTVVSTASSGGSNQGCTNHNSSGWGDGWGWNSWGGWGDCDDNNGWH